VEAVGVKYKFSASTEIWRHFMFNWDNKKLAEVLELYGGNIFMAEMDYRAMGLTPGDWVMLVKEGYDNKVVSPTVMMLMTERAAVA
jgi:hypothetical protein